MQNGTIETLTKLNQQFYSTYAESFNKTRQKPWTAWSTIVPLLPHEKPLTVVDFGCGNGRWFRYLREAGVNIQSAIGLDLDLYLLQQAKLSFVKHPEYRFYQGDCIEQLDECLKHIINADVISSFGLWHHIPSFDLRKTILNKLLMCLKPNGIGIVSLWQFADDNEYAEKLILPEEVNKNIGVDINEFEPGDYFLGWQHERSVLRYCHSFSDDEIERLGVSAGRNFQVIRGFGNDALNAYLIVK